MMNGFVVFLASAALLMKAIWELAKITDLCMSTKYNLESRSIMSCAIDKYGKSLWNKEQLNFAGYVDASEERADHERFVNYLRANPTGVEVLHMWVDKRLVAQLVHYPLVIPCVTTAAGLLSYLLSSL